MYSQIRNGGVIPDPEVQPYRSATPEPSRALPQSTPPLFRSRGCGDDGQVVAPPVAGWLPPIMIPRRKSRPIPLLVRSSLIVALACTAPPPDPTPTQAHRRQRRLPAQYPRFWDTPTIDRMETDLLPDEAHFRQHPRSTSHSMACWFGQLAPIRAPARSGLRFWMMAGHRFRR